MTSLPAQMKTVAIVGKGGPDVLQEQQAPLPEIGADDVLIKVVAAGVNRPDIIQRLGLYPPPKGHSQLPGLEVSGTIAAKGTNVTNFEIGDEVMALVNGGGYAEYCLANTGSVLKKPTKLSWTEAAALPETFFTVWHNVFERCALRAGETFLVHGGTSGIGYTAIQLAKARGARAFTTAGSDEKCEACKSLGAEIAVNYKNEDFVEVLKTVTDGKGVDVILDIVGGDYIEKNLRLLGVDGRLVNIAFQKGSKATVDFMRMMLKRQTITGSTLRSRPDTFKAQVAASVERELLPLVDESKVKILIDSEYPLSQAAEAHKRMESSQHIGKIVLTI